MKICKRAISIQPLPWTVTKVRKKLTKTKLLKGWKQRKRDELGRTFVSFVLIPLDVELVVRYWSKLLGVFKTIERFLSAAAVAICVLQEYKLNFLEKMKLNHAYQFRKTFQNFLLGQLKAQIKLNLRTISPSANKVIKQMFNTKKETQKKLIKEKKQRGTMICGGRKESEQLLKFLKDIVLRNQYLWVMMNERKESRNCEEGKADKKHSLIKQLS